MEFSSAAARLTITRSAALAAALVAVCAWFGEAAAWSDFGHHAIALAAEERLDARTKAAIARAAGKTTYGDRLLARLSTWPDDIRRLKNPGPSPLDEDELREAEAFMAEFPDHPTWHYVNLPIGRPYPARADRYTRPNDVVGTLERCIDVLEGRASTFSKAVALRFLVHLVGDVHQPLHVGSAYFDVSDLSAPRLIGEPGRRRVVADLGGNRLAFATANLHATWDHGVVVALGANDAKALAAEILRVRVPAAATASGGPKTWPRAWASESSRVAAEVAYRPLRFGQASTKSPDSLELDRIAIVAPRYESYVRDPAVRNAARLQLARAALRLADLLNRLRWR